MAKANDSYAKVLSTVDAIKTLIEELGEGKSLSDIDFKLALKSFTPTKNWTFSTNPFDFLTCLLEKFMTYDEMVEWIAKVLVYELPAIELAVKGVILAHLKAKIDCSNDPRIPEKYRMKLNPLQRIVGFTFGEGLNNLSELVTISSQGTNVNVDVGNIVSDETMYDLATMTRGALIPIESIDLTNLLYFNPMGEMGQKKYFGTRKYYTIEDYDGKEVRKFYKYGEALKYANKHGYNPAEIINKSEVKTVWELCRAEDFNAFIWFTINKAFFPTPTIIDNNPDASGNTWTHYVYQKEPRDVFTNTLIDYDESFVNFNTVDTFPFANNDYQVSVLEHYFGDAKLREKNSVKPFIPGNVLIQLSGVSNSTVISICFRTDVTPVGGKKSGAIKRAEGGFKVSDLDFSDIDGTSGDSVVYPINDNDYVGGILYGDPTTIDGEHHFGYARDLYLSDPDKNGNKQVISTYYKINDAYFHEWRRNIRQDNFYCNASGKTSNKLGGTYMIQTHSPTDLKGELNTSENNMYKTYEAVKSYEINAYQAYRAYYDKRYKGRSFVDDYKDWAKISGDTAALEDRRQQILDIIAAKRVKKTVPYGPNEVNFFVYFPNNYSGRNDVAKDSKVKPMWYLINGSGTQTSGCDKCDKDEVRKDSNCACGDVPTTLSELGRGYEMRKDPISFTERYSSDSGDDSGRFSTIKKTNKAGGTSYWHYRVDHRVTKVKNEMLDKEVLSDKGDYIDKKSFYLNSSGYTGIESVPQRKAAIEKMQKEHTLYSFADVFFALEGLNEFITKDEKNKEYSVENDVNRNKFTFGEENPYGDSQFKPIFSNLKDVLNEKDIDFLGSVFYSGNVESVEVVGYANSQGHKESNKLLAQDRANSVTEWLKGFSKFKNVKTSSTIDVPKINPKGNNTFDSKVWRCVKVNIKFVQQSEIEVPVDETVNFSGKTRAIANVIGFRPQEYTMEFLPVSCNYKSANWYVNRRNYFTRNITELYNLSKHPRDYGKEFSIFNLEYMKDGNTLNGYNCGKSGNLRLSIMPRPFWYMPSASYLEQVSKDLGLKGLFKLGKAALPQPILFDARGKKDLFHGKYSPKVSSINPKKMLTKVVGTKEDGSPKEEFFAFVYDVTTTTDIKVNELYITKDDYFLWNNDTFSLALSLHECYPGITVYEFNFDFVMGMRLFDARVVADRLLNTVATFRSGGSIAKDEIEYQMRISNIVKNMIEADSSEVADCFFTFSNDEYEELLRKAEDRKANAMSFDDSVHKSTILSDKDISELLMGCNDNATPVEQVDILTRAINETTFTLTEEVLPEDKYNYQLNIILEMIRSLSAMIVETIFSPKVMLILEFNKIMLGDECNPGKKLTFEDIMTSFSKLIGKIVKELIETIERLMLEEILKKLLILLEKAIEAVITERMEAYLSIMRDLVENCLFIPDFGIRNLESLLDNVNYADIDSEGELKTDEC